MASNFLNELDIQILIFRLTGGTRGNQCKSKCLSSYYISDYPIGLLDAFLNITMSQFIEHAIEPLF